MSDELKRVFESVTDSIEVPTPDVAGVVKAGRRRIRLNGLVLVLLVLGLGLGGSYLIGSLPGPGSAESTRVSGGIETSNQNSTQEGISSITPAEVTDSRVASFAVRALAHAGLLDPLGHFNDYQGVEKSVDGWSVTFDTYLCKPSTCSSHPEGDNTRMTVELRDGALHASDLLGPGGADARSKLQQYSEQPGDEQVAVEFPFLNVAGPLEAPDEGISVYTSPLWTGSIPTEKGSGVECRIEVLNQDGSVVFERSLGVEELPSHEADRSGSIKIVGIPGSLELAGRIISIPCGLIP